jgi:hypothetical protein
MEAGIPFIFPLSYIHCHSDLKVLHKNLAIDKRFYLQKLTENINDYVSL